MHHAMKITQSFRSKPSATRFSDNLKTITGIRYAPVYFMKGRYAVTAAGDFTQEQVQQALTQR